MILKVFFFLPLFIYDFCYCILDTALHCRADYKTVLEEIHGLCRNTSSSPSTSPALRYQSGGGRGTFAGNFSAEERRSFFRHTDDQDAAIPCGFFKEFPIPELGELVHLIAFYTFAAIMRIILPSGASQMMQGPFCLFACYNCFVCRGAIIKNVTGYCSFYCSFRMQQPCFCSLTLMAGFQTGWPWKSAGAWWWPRRS